VEKYVPVIDDIDLRRFERIIHAAQKSLPEDIPAFVCRVNQLLYACDIRIKIDTGEVGSLYCQKMRSGNYCIRVNGPKSGRGAFRDYHLSLVRVPPGFRRRIRSRLALDLSVAK